MSESIQVLWRVLFADDFNGQRLRQSRYFESGQLAAKFVKRVEKMGGEVISVCKFELKPLTIGGQE